ncbi:MAG: hypothetical protein P8Y70_18060 [Candidatus Lokiarchaeota archaeon]
MNSASFTDKEFSALTLTWNYLDHMEDKIDQLRDDPSYYDSIEIFFVEALINIYEMLLLIDFNKEKVKNVRSKTDEFIQMLKRNSQMFYKEDDKALIKNPTELKKRYNLKFDRQEIYRVMYEGNRQNPLFIPINFKFSNLTDQMATIILLFYCLLYKVESPKARKNYEDSICYVFGAIETLLSLNSTNLSPREYVDHSLKGKTIKQALDISEKKRKKEEFDLFDIVKNFKIEDYDF